MSCVLCNKNNKYPKKRDKKTPKNKEKFSYFEDNTDIIKYSNLPYIISGQNQAVKKSQRYQSNG